MPTIEKGKGALVLRSPIAGASGKRLFQRLDVRGDGSRTDLQVITMVQECALPAGNARYRLDLK
jgi:hypothetical protein